MNYKSRIKLRLFPNGDEFSIEFWVEAGLLYARKGEITYRLTREQVKRLRDKLTRMLRHL